MSTTAAPGAPTLVRLAAPPVAATRLVIVWVALAVGAVGVCLVELLSAVNALNRWGLALCWVVVLAVATFLARHGWAPFWRRAGHRVRQGWAAGTRVDRLAVLAVAALLLAELVVALVAEPNNYDSQTYHLPRIEHWVQDGNVGIFPTAIHRQVTLPPGAEYLLLNLRLITGADWAYNLVQYGAGLLCLVAATRIVAQFGGGRRAQLITAALVASTPMVALQATSTQTDLVVAAWVVCVATLVLDGVQRTAGLADVALLGAGTGLTAVSKTTGLLLVGPLLVLWGFGQLRQRGLLRTAAVSVALLAIAAVIAGPYLIRMTVTFGSPLGPPQLSTSIPMQRHDPGAILVNALRIGQTALDTPWGGLRSVTAAATRGVAHVVGVNVNDPAITFGGSAFPVAAWYPDEDRVSFPIAGVLAVVAFVVAILRPHRLSPDRPTLVRGYAAAVGLAFALYAATLKWQPWGNRLLLFILVAALPLAGLWLGGRITVGRGAGPVHHGRVGNPRVVAGAVTAVLVVSLVAGYLAVGYGFPRRLVGAGSVLTTSPDATRFLRRPQWLPDYQWGAAQVTATGATRVGLIEGNDDWEYPWWLFLPGRQLVALTSALPQAPAPAADTVGVIVCTAKDTVCRAKIPPGWTAARHGIVLVAHP